MSEKISQIYKKLIVSCQALPDEPLHSSFIMGRMAKAAKEGGACGIRANSREDIEEIKEVSKEPEKKSETTTEQVDKYESDQSKMIKELFDGKYIN